MKTKHLSWTGNCSLGCFFSFQLRDPTLHWTATLLCITTDNILRSQSTWDREEHYLSSEEETCRHRCHLWARPLPSQLTFLGNVNMEKLLRSTGRTQLLHPAASPAQEQTGPKPSARNKCLDQKAHPGVTHATAGSFLCSHTGTRSDGRRSL